MFQKKKWFKIQERRLVLIWYEIIIKIKWTIKKINNIHSHNLHSLNPNCAVPIKDYWVTSIQHPNLQTTKDQSVNKLSSPYFNSINVSQPFSFNILPFVNKLDQMLRPVRWQKRKLRNLISPAGSLDQRPTNAYWVHSNMQDFVK